MNKVSVVAMASVLTGKAARLLLAAGMVAALAAGLTGGGGAKATAAPSARAGAGPTVFYQLSCKGGFCLATGYYTKPGHRPIALLEAWNGRIWRTFPKPRYYDNSDITCGAESFCLAGTLPPKLRKIRTVEWNGRTWQAFKPQPPVPYEVICTSAKFCATSGSTGFTMLTGSAVIDSWTGGTSWQHMPGVGSSCGGPWCSLSYFTCATATICVDQGSYCTDDNCTSQVDFNELWNGTIWSSTTSNFGPGGYQACAGRSFCLSLTGDTATISRDWGGSWHDASSGLAAACKLAGCYKFYVLSCGSSWSCVALTSKSQTAPAADALIWNGVSWKAARIARIGGRLPTLTMLSCGSRNSCAALGTYQPATSHNSHPVAEHWNGSTWRVTPIPTTP